MAKRRYTPKAALTLRTNAPYRARKGLALTARLRKIRKRAYGATRRNKVNIRADRLWKAKLVPIKRYLKGKNARRFDLGVKVGGRMRRVWD